MAKIEVDGVEYKVTEHLGFQAGFPAKAVATKEGEKVAVKENGKWRFWSVGDRL